MSLAIHPSAPPSAKRGMGYKVTFSTSGGVQPVTYALTVGDLPDGFTLTPGPNGTAVLEGVTPDDADIDSGSTFTVEATDSSGSPQTATTTGNGPTHILDGANSEGQHFNGSDAGPFETVDDFTAGNQSLVDQLKRKWPDVPPQVQAP